MNLFKNVNHYIFYIVLWVRLALLDILLIELLILNHYFINKLHQKLSKWSNNFSKINVGTHLICVFLRKTMPNFCNNKFKCLKPIDFPTSEFSNFLKK